MTLSRVVLVFIVLIGVALPASASMSRPNAIDREVDAIPTAQLLSQPASTLIDADRQVAATRLMSWEAPGRLTMVIFEILILAYFWQSGTAARVRDALRLRINSMFGLRFVFGATLGAIAKIVALPFEFFRHLRPFPFEGLETIEFHVPVQVVAGAFHDEDDLLPHMPVLAGTLAVFEKLHVGLDAAFPRIELLVDEMLDQAVGGALPRHVLGFDDIGARLVLPAELRRGRDGVGVKRAACRAGMRCVLVFERHCAFLALRRPPGVCTRPALRAASRAAIRRSSERAGA